MIKAADLRIGNYILYLDELYIVDGIRYEPGAPSSKWRILFRTVDDNNPANQVLRSGKMENWIQPVPLTVDILKRCGFQPALENPSPAYGPMDYTLTYDDTEHHREYLTVWHEDDGRWFLNEFGYIPLQYLHQLQNLTYSLRGKELEINLPLPKPTEP
jgi:hypothetical protein